MSMQVGYKCLVCSIINSIDKMILPKYVKNTFRKRAKELHYSRSYSFHNIDKITANIKSNLFYVVQYVYYFTFIIFNDKQ